MSNKKDMLKYKNFKRLKRKEKAIKNCQGFTSSDNIHCYSKKKINKLVPLDFIEKVSAGTRMGNLSPADTCY
jgi:hypothetical protein